MPGPRPISNLAKTAATAVLSASIFLAVGCDDPAEDMQQTMVDQQKKQADAAKQLPKIPTTQDLLSGARTTTALGPLPMTMSVPSSWRVAVVSGATNLQGWTPSGNEVAIQLSSRPTVKKEALDYAIRSAKKEQTDNPASVLKVEVRPFGSGGMQIMERQGVGEPRDYPIMDKTGKTQITTEQPFKWTISVFAPHGGDAYQVYELNFIGLTKSQYDKDKDFLQDILGTLTYASNAGATTGPSSMPAAAGAVALPTTLP
jgi:hypothetical protein